MGRYAPPPEGQSIYVIYVEFFMGGLSLLPHSFAHLFMSVWTQLFSTLGYSSILLIYFIAQIVLALAIGSISVGSFSL